MPDPIDLRRLRGPLHAFLADALAAFTKGHPGERVSAAMLNLFPFHDGPGPDTHLCLDTRAHSDEVVSKWQHNSPDWYGEDAAGRFGDSPEDCRYWEAGFAALEPFPSPLAVMDEGGKVIPFLDTNGTRREADVAAGGVRPAGWCPRTPRRASPADPRPGRAVRRPGR